MDSEKQSIGAKKQMESHALKYSPGYKKDKEKGWNYTFWSKDFDGMAYKTMLRQLISKWGIMSIDLQTAMDADMAVINEDGTKDYVDIEENVIDMEHTSTEEVSDNQQEQSTKTEITQQPTGAASALFGNK